MQKQQTNIRESNIKRFVLIKLNRHLKIMNSALFYVWEDARDWIIEITLWICTIAIWGLYPVFVFIPEFPTECSWGSDGVVEGLKASISFVY